MKQFIATLAAGLLAAGPALAQDLSDGTFEKWYAHIVPTKQELAWRDIPWEPSLWDGVVRAQEENKPILLWAMHGHPLAEV